MKIDIVNITKFLEFVIGLLSALITIMLVVARQRNLIKSPFTKTQKHKKDSHEANTSHDVVFDPRTGELVVSETNSNDSFFASIPEDGFAGDPNYRENLSESLSFENQHLSNYYRQTLYQSNVSFWFSLISASFGFSLIIFAVVLHTTTTLDKTVITLISGVIIDTVSALFFVQSNKAQKAVGVFFEKLRKDKQIHDSRKMCDTIQDVEKRDSLKVKISLALLGLQDIDRL